MNPVLALKRYFSAVVRGRAGAVLAQMALALVVVSVLVADSHAAADTLWKMGRAVIRETRGRMGEAELSLKLSLRNNGATGKVPVRVLGRWGGAGKRPYGDRGGLRGRSRNIEGFEDLGVFGREVAYKRTVILDITLRPLGAVPRGVKSVTVVVMTGDVETDRRTIGLELR